MKKNNNLPLADMLNSISKIDKYLKSVRFKKFLKVGSK